MAAFAFTRRSLLAKNGNRPRLRAQGLTLVMFLLSWGLAHAFQKAEPDTQQPAAVEPAVELDYDFRDSRPLPKEIRLAGALHNLKTLAEETGFRMTIADRPNPIGRAGMEMHTRLRGDFEITAGYEILNAAVPTEGNGVGFEFFAHTVHTPQQGLGVYRLTRVDDGDVYLVSRNYINSDGNPGWDQKQISTNAKSGRLRITRSGTVATVLAAEGKDGVFKELSRKELGPDDITVIWLMAYTGHAQNSVDLRVTDLRIRAGAPIPTPPRGEVAGAEGEPDAPKLWRFVVIGLIALLICAVGLAAMMRRQGDDKNKSR